MANIIYSDLQMVVVTIKSIPNSAPWLGQTTYLIDQSGQTTAVLAQTDQPTVGVTLAPVPYTTQAQTPLPSSTASSLPLGWDYEGCYNDLFPHARVLSLEQPYNMNLTVQACVWSCFRLGYSISGLEYHNQCFCGNSILNGGTLADWDFDCNMTCSGNKMEICGGNNTLSIYSNRTLTASQLAPAQTSELTMAAPTIAPSPTPAISQTPISAGTISGAGIAAVMGITLVVALIFCLRRRIKRNRAKRENRMQTLRANTQARPLADRILSWEDLTKHTDGDGHGLGLKYADIGSHPSLPDLKESYEQLRRKKQPSFPTEFESPDTYIASTAKYSSPQRASARAQLNQPTSILKHPTPAKTMNKAQRVLGGEDEQDPMVVPATRNLGLAKKCVRFGVNQIREFGRSPFLSYGSNASDA